ncbi:MAG: TetR/AcrR family transcriptional regulator [Thermoleophilaceae bacterium]
MPRRSATQVAGSRAATLDRAVRVASRSGLEGLTIGRLAGDLGMSKSGLIGRFGNKEELQLATLGRAVDVFTREVWLSAEQQPSGRARLLALCDAWLDLFRREVFPGGCFLTTASVEFDGRPGPVRDAIAATMRRWLALLERELQVAADAGEIAPDVDPADAAFELNALASGASTAFQLHGDPKALGRARRAMHRVLTAP